jgi:Glycosyltransferase family 87
VSKSTARSFLALRGYIQGPHPDLFIGSLRFPPPSSRIVTYVTYFGAACALLFVRAAQIKHLGWGSGYDVGLYQSYARAWASGSAPYVGFAPEYPPGALCLFLLPHLFSNGEDYSHAFACEMGLLDLASCLLVVAWARRLRPARAGFAIRAALGYLVVSTALFPVIYSRFDLAPAAISIAALYLVYGRYEGWGSALLGAAGAVKLWPLALAPLAAIRAYRREGLSGAIRVACFTGLGVAAVVGPFLPRAGWLVGRFLEYHGARGIEVGSTWASLAFVLDLLHISPAKPEHNFGAFHVGGPAAVVFVKISTAATLACVLIPPVRGWFRGLGGPHDRNGAIGLRVATATVLGFMIGGKVLSPQFALWLAPLLPLVATGPLTGTAAVLAAALTTVEYPYTAAALEMVEPGHKVAVLCIVARNLLLVALYVALLRSPRSSRSEKRPMRASRLPVESAQPGASPTDVSA